MTVPPRESRVNRVRRRALGEVAAATLVPGRVDVTGDSRSREVTVARRQRLEDPLVLLDRTLERLTRSRER